MQKLLLLSTLLAACTDQAASTSSTVAEVRLDNGNTVTFLDTGNGSLAIKQDYAMGVQPVDTANLSAVGVFRAIAPGREVPAALSDAQARADEARATRPPLVATKPIPWIDNTTIDDQWFVGHYCALQGWEDVNKCGYNYTGNWAWYFTDTDRYLGVVCADRGNVSFKTTIDGDVHDYDVTQGHCVGYGWTSGWLNETARIDVYAVGGTDRYHVSAKFGD